MPQRASFAVVVPLLCAAVLLAGCRVDTQPQTVVRHVPEKSVALREAGYDGEYRLFVARQSGRYKPLEPQGEPIATHRLSRGQPLGFSRSIGGHDLTAVAGDEHVVLEPGQSYVWQMSATAGQIDRFKTVLLIVTIAGLVIGIGVAAAGAGPYWNLPVVAA